MKEIVEELLSLNPCMRVVINVIALETLASVISMLDELSIDGEIVSVQVSRARKAGGYHLMQGRILFMWSALEGRRRKHERDSFCRAQKRKRKNSDHLRLSGSSEAAGTSSCSL